MAHFFDTRTHLDIFVEGDEAGQYVTGIEVNAISQEVVLRIGPKVRLYTANRAQAEALFDAVAELAGIWREREPDTATIDAVLAPGEDPVSARMERDGLTEDEAIAALREEREA